jgi:CHAT domain-containing protein/tetratricopeptide (TPR) repeat protein
LTCSFCPDGLFGQAADSVGTQKPTDDAVRHAKELFASGKTRLASQSFRDILANALQTNDPRGQAAAHLALGEVALRRALFADGRVEAEKARMLYLALSDLSGVARADRLLGNVAYELGDKKDAEHLYSKALARFEEASEQEERALTLLDLAAESTQFTDETKAREQQALGIAEDLRKRRLECQAHQALGRLYYYQGDWNSALQEYGAAERLALDLENTVELARIFVGQAIVQIDNGHPAEALELCRRAHSLARESEDQSTYVNALNQQGAAYLVQGDFRKACPFFYKARALAKKFSLSNLMDATLDNLGNCLVEQRDFRGAVRLLEAGLRQHPNADQAEYRFLTLAQAYDELRDYQRAREAANRALELARSANNKPLLPDLLHLKAHAEDGLGQTDAALADARQALEAIEELRAHLAPSDFTKRGFADSTQELLGEMIGLLQKSGNDREALELSERVRARALLDLLASRDSEEKAAREQHTTGMPADRPAEHSAGQGTQLQAEDGGPQLASLASAVPLSVTEMTSVARRLGSTLLIYWVESEQATYIWVLAPTGEIHSARVSVTAKSLENRIRGLWPSAGRARRGTYTSASPPINRGSTTVDTRGGTRLPLDQVQQGDWRGLYQLLIRPIEQWLPVGPDGRLTIIGHGPLLLLPFASLEDNHGRYLLERYALSYSPSVSVLQFTHERKVDVESHPPKYLLVADPYPVAQIANAPPLPPLPGARREIAAVSRLLSGQIVNTLQGAEAREDRLQELSKKSTIIHLATHAIAQDERPFDSLLVLARSGNSAPQTGRLTAREIFGMDLHADLVFLSACRSGAGKVSGDGVIGLTRAFLYAGTASVIASLWDVADQPTSQLVVDFYRNWLRDKDKALALRAAQLHLLRELRAGHVKIRTPSGDIVLPEAPVFWASFILLGEP